MDDIKFNAMQELIVNIRNHPIDEYIITLEDYIDLTEYFIYCETHDIDSRNKAIDLIKSRRGIYTLFSKKLKCNIEEILNG